MTKLSPIITDIVHTATQAELTDDEQIQRQGLADIYDAIASVLHLDHRGFQSHNHPIAQSPNPPIIPGCPSLGPKVFPSGADGTEPAAIEQSNNPNNPNNSSNPFYEFHGLKLHRFGGPGLDAKLIGKRVNHPSSQPSVQVFEIDLKRGSLATGARAFVTENGERLFSIVGGKSFTAVHEMAVSALHALLKRRDKANKRHKARRAAKRAAAAKALVNKELA